ncbi:MAG: DUF1573 domain-containing protein [Planctomycetota bacterium]
MTKFPLFLVLAFLAGTTVAWAINRQRFGGPAYFAKFTMEEGPESFDNLNSGQPDDETDSNARVEVLSELEHDFGVMAPNTEGEHTFRIKNIGTADLTLKLGATTCKCTLGELENSALAPGEETDVKLSWTVKADQPEFNQTAQVITNDPSRVVLTLKITGKVVQDFEVVPETWTFGAVPTGEPIEMVGSIYNFTDKDIRPAELRFSSQEMTDLATFEVEPFNPGEDSEGARANARQAFRVKIKLAAGMRQGAVSQNFEFGFQSVDEEGNDVPTFDAEGIEMEKPYIVASTVGRVVGYLSMLPNSKISGEPGGGYIFNIGNIGKEDDLVVKTFVVLKGEQRENTQLIVSEIVPNSLISAKLGEPKGRGSMTLYPLEITFNPGSETVSREGKNAGDYGQVMIESDNPKVTKMRIALKFSVEGR